VDCPETTLFQSVDEFKRSPVGLALPWVIKLNWGGQGDSVWVVKTARDQDRAMTRLVAMEKTGQPGFLVQQHIDAQGRCLRVVVVGDHIVSYWRIQSATQPFGTGVAHGAQIDHAADPDLQEKAAAIVRQISRQTRLQLGGFDFIFNRSALNHGTATPLLLEINYFFGRTGLGGSQGFYNIFTEAVDRWLSDIGLHR
jgi:ribosomal protein S6--L-glutamate ligase